MLYKLENIEKIKKLISENILELKNDRLYFNNKLLTMTKKNKTYTLYYDDKLFQPKAALVAAIILEICIPKRTELNLTSEIIKKENLIFTIRTQKSYNSEPANRKFTKETCVQLRRDYRTGNYSYRDLEKKYNLCRPQISSILYNTSSATFWKSVSDLELPLVKGEIIKKTKKQPKREITKEARMKISDAMKKRHAAGLHPKIAPAVKKPVIEKIKLPVDKVKKPVIEKIKLPVNKTKTKSVFDLFMLEAKKILRK